MVGTDHGGIQDQERTYQKWLVVTQDCDLDQTDETVTESVVELRPILTEDPPKELGLRSQRFRLSLTPGDREYLHAMSPRAMVSGSVLACIREAQGMIGELPEVRRTSLVTWLGLRYDRPAVPRHLGALMKRIAETISRRKNRPVGRLVRDVLVQVDDIEPSPHYSLFAVVAGAADVEDVRRWLAEVAREVSVELGVCDIIEAGTAAQVSLELIETSYSADVSDVTWRSGELDGAR